MDFSRYPNDKLTDHAMAAWSGTPCLGAFSHGEGLYAAATFARPDAGCTSVSCSLALDGPSSAHQDTASAQRVSLVIRSDDSGMSHSANTGSGHLRGIALSLSMCNTPTAPRFPATAKSFTPRRWRSTLCNTNEGPIALIGRRQPRFNLVVTHVGIDDQELGALGDGTGDDSLPRVGESTRVWSRVSASAFRLATFSS